MPEKIITIYYFFDQFLHAIGHRDDPQAQQSTAGVMTIAAIAGQFFTRTSCPCGGTREDENAIMARVAG